jgi:ABC-type transport system involved in cytochrome c biogenesis permease component
MSALLALFLRSLRIHLRAKSTIVARVALIGIILFFLFAAHATALATGAPGLHFFELVMVLNLWFLTLGAVSYFASAITEEKEEGTLGLLQMTDLDPLAILLGKSTTRLCGALLLLVVQVPFTLLAIALGGISARQIFAAYATLGGYTFFLSNLALLASVVAPRTAIASMFTGGFLVIEPLLVAVMKAAPKLAALPQLRGKATGIAATLADWSVVLTDASPFHRLGEIVTTGFAGSVFGGQFWTCVLAGFVCFSLAWALFDVFAGDSRFVSGRIVPRPGSRFSRFAPSRAWTISAMAWKDYYFLHGGPLVNFAKLAAYGLLCIFLFYNVRNDADPFASGAGAIVGVMVFALTVELGVIGSRILRDEVRNKTLVGLAGLPFAMKHIVLMKVDGAKRTLLPALVWLGFGAALGIASIVANGGHDVWGWIGGALAIAYVGTQAWLFAHVAAYYSLRLKWGALPLSFGVCVIANIFGGMMCFGVFVAPIIALILVPSLRDSIHARLEQLASED